MNAVKILIIILKLSWSVFEETKEDVVKSLRGVGSAENFSIPQ